MSVYKKYIKYSIIIPTYKIDISFFERNINSIYDNFDMYNKELIVVSNGQSDEFNNYFLEKSKMLGFKFLIYDRPLGYAVAINEGIKYSSGDFIILLNDDCEFYKSILNDIHIMLLKEPFDLFENVGVTGVSVHNFGRYAGNKRLICKPFILFFLAMIRRDELIDYGLLNEIFEVGGYEDSEYCIRLEKYGYKNYMIPYDRMVPYSYITTYPFYHYGTYTLKDMKEHDEAVERNFWLGYNLIVSEYTNDELKNLKKLFDDRLYKKVLDYINLYKLNVNELNICEIGCRNGIIFKYLDFDNIDKYYGFDIDKYMIYSSNLNYQYNNVNFCLLNEYIDVFKTKEFFDSNIVISLDVFNISEWNDIKDYFKGKEYIFKFKDVDKFFISDNLKKVVLNVFFNEVNNLFMVFDEYIVSYIKKLLKYDLKYVHLVFDNEKDKNRFKKSIEYEFLKNLLYEKGIILSLV